MEYIFYILGLIAILSTIKVITHNNPMYALLYLVVSLLSISGIFFLVGAYFAGVLEVIIYTGAILVLFIFNIMFINVDNNLNLSINYYYKIITWLISLLLLMILIYGIYINNYNNNNLFSNQLISIETIAISLFGDYILVVELSTLLLLSSLIISCHLGNRKIVN